MNNKIIIFGSSYQANVVYNELSWLKKSVIGFCDDANKGKNILHKNRKLKNLGKFEEIPTKILKNSVGVIGIGENKIRKQIVDKVKRVKNDFKWIKLVSRFAKVSPNTVIGEGTVILSGSVIRNNVKIGDHCLINSSCSIDHDNQIDDFASCGPGVITGGNVKVGKMSFIGIGSTIKHSIKIETNVIIGGHSFVNKNCRKEFLYFGVPAKKIKSVKSMKSQF